MTAPVNLTWTGEAFEPVNRFWAVKCDQRFVVGQVYTLDEVHARSHATHAHYFATLHDMFMSLPEHIAPQFPTEEHFRKYALIRTGFHNMTKHVCKSAAEADRLAAAIRPYDTYQIVTCEDSIVTVYNAISQDMKAMDKATFQRSKEAVLDFCSELLGLEPAETRRSAGMEPQAISNSGASSPSPDTADGIPSSASAGSVSPGTASQPIEDETRGQLIAFTSAVVDVLKTDLGLNMKHSRINELERDWKVTLDESGHAELGKIKDLAMHVINGRPVQKFINFMASDILGCSAGELGGDSA